jgi:acetyl-CoA carboxylase biotin carboxylase subunit
MGALALQVVKASGYRNAGTVEFLLDAAGKPYFMEVNARIQVEHPVTEMTTGIDLVRAQLEIAAGRPLALKQEAIRPRGHAIECRIVAEDPEHGFRPSPGRVVALRLPSGPGVRVETALQAGEEISLYYDPLIAKLIAWGRDRAEAIARMRRALDEFLIAGIRTTIPFHREVMADGEFAAGRIDIGWCDRNVTRLVAPPAAAGAGPAVGGATASTAGDHEAAETAAAIAAAIAAHLDAGRPIAAEAAGAVSAWVLDGRRAQMLGRGLPRI